MRLLAASVHRNAVGGLSSLSAIKAPPSLSASMSKTGTHRNHLMKDTRIMRAPIWLVIPLTVIICAPAQAQQSSSTPQTVKIGVLSDMSGLYADIGGPGSVTAASMAVEDFKPETHNLKVEIVSADHQNKPDIGSGIARRWFDVEQVNAIADVPNSGVALAVANVTREKNGVFLVSGAADSDLTVKQCSPNTVHWTYDTWALAHGTGGAIVRQGGKTWF